MVTSKTAMQQYMVNSVLYPADSIAEVAITDIYNDRYVAITVENVTRYRPLTKTERAAKVIRLSVTSDMVVKFYRYGFFIDDQCVIAGDTCLQRILLSDFLSAEHEKSYCYGYDTDLSCPSCMCATNDVWKICNDRYVYTGYYQVTIKTSETAAIKVISQDSLYQAAPIAERASFPVCDAINPQVILPSETGQSVTPGTYYVKNGTIFTDGMNSYIIDKNCILQF